MTGYHNRPETHDAYEITEWLAQQHEACWTSMTGSSTYCTYPPTRRRVSSAGIARWICGYAHEPSEATLVVRYRMGILTAGGASEWNCRDLK